MRKITKSLISSIRSHRSRADLSGSIKKPVIDPLYKIRLQDIYLKEIKSAENAVDSHVKPLLPLLIQRQDGVSDVFDKFKKAFKFVFVDYFGAITVGGDPNTLSYRRKVVKKTDKVIENADKNHKKQFTKAYKKLTNVQPIETEPGLKDTLEIASLDNVQRITTISKDYFSEIQDSIFNGLRSGTANETVVEEIEEIIKKSGTKKKANAKLIATDQIQKLNGDLDKIRQKANGGTRYIWRTRNNQRVREDHEDLNGAVFEWGKPPITVTTGKRSGERNEPGQDINCKCQAEMVVEDMLGITSNKIKKAEEKTLKLKSQGRI